MSESVIEAPPSLDEDGEGETPVQSAPAMDQSTMSPTTVTNNSAALDSSKDETPSLPKDTSPGCSPGQLGHFNGFNVSRVKKVKLEGTGE